MFSKNLRWHHTWVCVLLSSRAKTSRDNRWLVPPLGAHVFPLSFPIRCLFRFVAGKLELSRSLFKVDLWRISKIDLWLVAIWLVATSDCRDVRLLVKIRRLYSRFYLSVDHKSGVSTSVRQVSTTNNKNILKSIGRLGGFALRDWPQFELSSPHCDSCCPSGLSQSGKNECRTSTLPAAGQPPHRSTIYTLQLIYMVWAKADDDAWQKLDLITLWSWESSA